MIEQQGMVLSADQGRIRVRLGSRSACAACDQGRGCGAGVFGRLLQRRPVVLEFANTLSARVGAAVVVGLPESMFLRLLSLFYLAPLLAALGGAILGHYIGVETHANDSTTDLLSMAAALVAGAAALLWGRGLSKDFPGPAAIQLLRVAKSPGDQACDEYQANAPSQSD